MQKVISAGSVGSAIGAGFSGATPLDRCTVSARAVGRPSAAIWIERGTASCCADRYVVIKDRPPPAGILRTTVPPAGPTQLPPLPAPKISALLPGSVPTG